MLRRIRTGFVLSVLAFLVSLSYVSGWPWNTDMIQQPTIRPYQTVILPPPDSVPVGGEHYLPRNIIAERLKNPVAATPTSIENGKKMFLTYCAPCHGINGTGHGTVAQGEFQPPDLTGERIQKMNDATIFGTITDGWLTMPSYRETMTIQERWDTVNYVRHLQATKQH